MELALKALESFNALLVENWKEAREKYGPVESMAVLEAGQVLNVMELAKLLSQNEADRMKGRITALEQKVGELQTRQKLTGLAETRGTTITTTSVEGRREGPPQVRRGER